MILIYILSNSSNCNDFEDPWSSFPYCKLFQVWYFIFVVCHAVPLNPQSFLYILHYILLVYSRSCTVHISKNSVLTVLCVNLKPSAPLYPQLLKHYTNAVFLLLVVIICIFVILLSLLWHCCLGTGKTSCSQKTEWRLRDLCARYKPVEGQRRRRIWRPDCCGETVEDCCWWCCWRYSLTGVSLYLADFCVLYNCIFTLPW